MTAHEQFIQHSNVPFCRRCACAAGVWGQLSLRFKPCAARRASSDAFGRMQLGRAKQPSTAHAHTPAHVQLARVSCAATRRCQHTLHTACPAMQEKMVATLLYVHAAWSNAGL
jgi:hypothetical protein